MCEGRELGRATALSGAENRKPASFPGTLGLRHPKIPLNHPLPTSCLWCWV
jgi:hypothetical protein